MTAQILLLGFLFGLRHATDSDHVLAMTTIVSRTHRLTDAIRTGVLWGLGHSLTLLGVGCGILIFGLVIPPSLAAWMELAVALMLVVLGALNLVACLRKKSAAPDTAVGTSVRTRDSVRPVVIGVVHGLAGSAAMALLALASIRSPWGAVAYLVLFAIGTMAGMAALTTMIALPFAVAAERSARWARLISAGSGALSVSVGVMLGYQLGIPR